MSIAWHGLWNQRTVSKEVIRGRDVIAGLIPKIREPQQWPVQKEDRCEDQREDVDDTKTKRL